MNKKEIESSKVFNALGTDKRLGIFLACKDKSLTVNEIASKLKITQSDASQQIKILVHSGLILKSKRSTIVTCTALVGKLADAVNNVMGEK